MAEQIELTNSHVVGIETIDVHSRDVGHVCVVVVDDNRVESCLSGVGRDDDRRLFGEVHSKIDNAAQV